MNLQRVNLQRGTVGLDASRAAPAGDGGRRPPERRSSVGLCLRGLERAGALVNFTRQGYGRFRCADDSRNGLFRRGA